MAEMTSQGNLGASGDTLLEVRGLKKYFPIQQGLLRKTVGYVKAVDDVNLKVHAGETLGLVGESGCGKTTASRCIIRLYEPTDGEVLFQSRTLGENGQTRMVNLLELGPEELTKVRQEIAMIFQDPINSLNPRMSVSDIIAEPLVIHGKYDKTSSEDMIVDLLKRVGLRADRKSVV